jgi:hypothetical protein
MEKGMPVLTVAEAKELAHYIKNSHARIFDAIPLGKWLTAISRASGFRDWNVMSAKAAKLPDPECDTWGYSYLGFAVVCAPERASSYHVIHDYSSNPNMAQVAEQLAKSVVSGSAHRFARATSTFSLLDPLDADDDCPEFYFPKKRKHSTALPPAQVKIADGEVTIWVWWLQQSYLLRAERPSDPKPFASYTLDEQSTTSKNECITTHFLHKLTGNALPKRKCYYCTELPNERYTYRLMLVQEGSREGQATEYAYDNHDSAVEQKMALNFKLGLSERDTQVISAVFAQYDPYYEEEYFDDYSHYND